MQYQKSNFSKSLTKRVLVFYINFRYRTEFIHSFINTVYYFLLITLVIYLNIFVSTSKSFDFAFIYVQNLFDYVICFEVTISCAKIEKNFHTNSGQFEKLRHIIFSIQCPAYYYSSLQ